MTYFIFLKSLRSLGEFRKNPHVKIPPKSPCANFQSLGIFKDPKFYSEIILLSFRPSRGPFFFFELADFPSPPHWASASRPAQPTIMAQPATGRLLPPLVGHHRRPGESSSCADACLGLLLGRDAGLL
jgi:hypothetical protein